MSSTNNKKSFKQKFPNISLIMNNAHETVIDESFITGLGYEKLIQELLVFSDLETEDKFYRQHEGNTIQQVYNYYSSNWYITAEDISAKQELTRTVLGNHKEENDANTEFND